MGRHADKDADVVCPDGLHHFFREGRCWRQYGRTAYQRQQHAVEKPVDVVGLDGGDDAILGPNAMMGGNEQSFTKEVGCSLAPELGCTGTAASEQVQYCSCSWS